ncbi:MAG: bifunctional oligoribonuclease/PAP phosphatase NrnA [candidate division Zixibacteria bacterium]|nr:bifunctional oligoribonuclease/PAP phosphatase NrnA [candidate division Zixibacteria bacterium]
MTEPVKSILELIKKSKRVLITSHQDPDGDSIGSQLAIGEYVSSLGREVRIFNQGGLPTKYRFLDVEKKIVTEKTRPEADFKPDLVIVIECPTLQRIVWVQELVKDGTAIVNIDHHPDNVSFGTVNYLDSAAAAVGEMVYLILAEAKFAMTAKVAGWLYVAILTDTGRFRHSSTTSRCLNICSLLVALGADPKSLTDKIYFNLSQQNLKMLGHVLAGLESFEDGKISCLTLEQKTIQKYQVNSEDTEGLVDYSLFVNGAKVGALFKEITPGRTKVSLRSQNNLDIGQLARQMGGGGHKNAAGVAIDRPLPEAKEMILKELKKWI